jgi:hypothetical protein
MYTCTTREHITAELNWVQGGGGEGFRSLKHEIVECDVHLVWIKSGYNEDKSTP